MVNLAEPVYKHFHEMCVYNVRKHPTKRRCDNL